MKKYFLLVAAWGILAFNSFAQPCTLGNPGVKLNFTTPDGANCRIGLDLYFDLKHNPGGKWFWVHIWPSTAYANWNYSSPPTLLNGGLTGSIATFGVEHQGTNLVLQTVYPPDLSAPGFQYAGLVASEGVGTMAGAERYTIKNLVLTVPGGCNVPQSFIADVWESQSALSQNVHCFVKGMTFFANDPAAGGFLICGTPRTYTFNIKTINPVGMTVDYNVYIDDGDGIFNITSDSIMVNSGTVTLNAANQFTYQSPALGYLPYAAQKPYSDRDLWVVVTAANLPNAVYAQLINSCIPLPVQFGTFTGERNGDWVWLKWVTLSEQNNKGYYIEKWDDARGWITVYFMPTLAAGGNSTDALTYKYSDYNNSGKTSLYRLRQVDIDGKSIFSATISVRGNNQQERIAVYPNPVRDGQLTLDTDMDMSELYISLYTIDGRTIKEWANTVSNKLALGSAINPGVYFLQARHKMTGKTWRFKIIVTR